MIIIKNLFLIIYLEINEYRINIKEYLRSIISVKSYLFLFNKNIKNLINFNKKNYMLNLIKINLF